MQTKQRQHVQLLAAALVIGGMTPLDQLKKDEKGYTVHSGTASGGQEVHSLKSKIDAKAKVISLKQTNGQEITMTTAEAEVAFAQLLPQLANINQAEQ